MYYNKNNNDERETSTRTSTRTIQRKSLKENCNTGKPIITSLMLFGRKTSLYIKPEDIPVWLQFKELAKMERVKVSHLAEIAIKEYVRRHHPGNPQLPLTRFAIPNVKIPKPRRDPEKQRARRMLAAVLKHVRQGHRLNPKAREYYAQLARDNQDLQEASELLKLFSPGDVEVHE